MQTHFHSRSSLTHLHRLSRVSASTIPPNATLSTQVQLPRGASYWSWMASSRRQLPSRPVVATDGEHMRNSTAVQRQQQQPDTICARSGRFPCTCPPAHTCKTCACPLHLHLPPPHLLRPPTHAHAHAHARAHARANTRKRTCVVTAHTHAFSPSFHRDTLPSPQDTARTLPLPIAHRGSEKKPGSEGGRGRQQACKVGCIVCYQRMCACVRARISAWDADLLPSRVLSPLTHHTSENRNTQNDTQITLLPLHPLSRSRTQTHTHKHAACPCRLPDYIRSPVRLAHPTPYTLHPTPYTLRLTPYALHPTPCTLRPRTPYTLRPTRRTPHPEPLALNPKPTFSILQPKPATPQPRP